MDDRRLAVVLPPGLAETAGLEPATSGVKTQRVYPLPPRLHRACPAHIRYQTDPLRPVQGWARIPEGSNLIPLGTITLPTCAHHRQG